MTKKVAVIGSGLGGLTSALLLSKKGYKVTVFEMGSFPGGKANSLHINKFRFDTGPSLITMPFILEEILQTAGYKLKNYLKLQKLDMLCKYFYPDKSVLNAYSDVEKFSNEIENKTSDTPSTLKKHLNYCKKIYDLTTDIFLLNSPTNLKNLLSAKSIKSLLNLKSIDVFRTVDEANKSFFIDPKTIQLFNRYATYSGSNPYHAPATLNTIQHVEYSLGGYICEGGVYKIVEVLFKLCKEMGVKFHFNSVVKKINLNGNKVNGISYINKNEDDLTENYDIIISNADVNSTYKNMLSDSASRASKRYESLEPSSSAIVFYWGIKGDHPDLEIHNIIFSGNYEKEFEEIFDLKKCPEDPTIYIYISSKFNKSDAPEGFENWFVLINTPYISGQDWKEEIKKTRERVINKINSIREIDLNKLIVEEEVLTPEKIESQTGSRLGSIYGISSNSRTAAFLRQQNRSKKYKGLYFCGGSSHPGGGIPLVMLSGKLAVDQILKYEK
ncbi:MAG: phytoene desaturase [Ignavibacteria bacterium]|nr:phytoene desaturase [Ignavibacteria bacterium]MBT8384042.1 phytoene desaturase [Ignavibacteria bacterium]MBT8392249.1 phytoene desaturase [Ignavibacteria bacterium]NNJ51756.1 phytoene desaturase [Ignavibacteriaceae bacterium]NNL21800.1 phytoene desaturase [Ignavibacteriaceae bacterium]